LFTEYGLVVKMKVNKNAISAIVLLTVLLALGSITTFHVGAQGQPSLSISPTVVQVNTSHGYWVGQVQLVGTGFGSNDPVSYVCGFGGSQSLRSQALSNGMFYVTCNFSNSGLPPGIYAFYAQDLTNQNIGPVTPTVYLTVEATTQTTYTNVTTVSTSATTTLTSFSTVRTTQTSNMTYISTVSSYVTSTELTTATVTLSSVTYTTTTTTNTVTATVATVVTVTSTQGTITVPSGFATVALVIAGASGYIEIANVGNFTSGQVVNLAVGQDYTVTVISATNATFSYWSVSSYNNGLAVDSPQTELTGLSVLGSGPQTLTAVFNAVGTPLP
jgi:hypothetical protein